MGERITGVQLDIADDGTVSVLLFPGEGGPTTIDHQEAQALVRDLLRVLNMLDADGRYVQGSYIAGREPDPATPTRTMTTTVDPDVPLEVARQLRRLAAGTQDHDFADALMYAARRLDGEDGGG